MDEVPITARPIEPFAPIIGNERTERFAGDLVATRDQLAGATLWHINSTAAGGGVAEMLQSVLSYPAVADIEVRWLVIEAGDEFFDLTKRIHHLLHGSSGDGGPLGDDQRKLYERTLDSEMAALRNLVRSGDVVVLHDPQTLGLAPGLGSLGAAVIWSCHIGADTPNTQTRRAWDFLLPYVRDTAAQTFTRASYRWDALAEQTAPVIPPCIDAFATKNQPLDDVSVGGILDASGVIPTPSGRQQSGFTRQDGTLGSVTHRAAMVEHEPIAGDAPVICQVSRWDPLKDHIGLMRAFVSDVSPDLGGQLVLAGPSTDSVDDDPEATETYDQLVQGWEGLPDAQRRRVHLCALPMDDVEENAAIVNALQLRSDVIVQKSLAEGFGLTVTEAMWKGRPTIGSRVGGIQDQIDPGRSGLLVDPTDPHELGSAVTSLLSDPGAAARIGDNARGTVIEHYLAPSYLTAQLGLIREVLQPAG